MIFRQKLLHVSLAISSLLASATATAAPLSDAAVQSLITQKATQIPLVTSPEVVARAALPGRNYGGATNPAQIISAYQRDANIHGGAAFRNCHNYRVQYFRCGFLNTKDIITYWWPVTTVEMANFTETDYAMSQLYQVYNETPVGTGLPYDPGHYQNALEYAREAMQRKTGTTGLPSIDPQVGLLPRIMKYYHGSFGALSHVSYHVLPTLMQMGVSKQPSWATYYMYSSLYVWATAFQHYFTYILTLYCGVFHVPVTPAEYFSDIMPSEEPSYDPAWSYARFPIHMGRLRASPAMCVARDVTSPLGEAFESPQISSIASQIGNSGAMIPSIPPYNNCAGTYGRAKPITEYSNDRVSHAALAMQTAFKGIDAQYRQGALLGFFNFRAFPITAIDKLQWVDAGGIGLSQCYPSIALPPYVGPSGFGVAATDVHRSLAEDVGVRRVTLWKFFGYCGKNICFGVK